jgi:hypothetical protein
MTPYTPGLPFGGATEKRRVLLARGVFREIAGRVPDPERARRLEAALNDAWLCLQLARVADDRALALAKRRTCARLLGEVLDAATLPGPGMARLAER